MVKRKSFRSHLAKGGIVVALAGVMTVGMAGAAFASDPYWSAPNSVANTDGLVTSYGVRAGSAGPDFLGISGTNFDFSGGSASQETQYDGYTSSTLSGISGAGLALWATSVNENVNPYYANLYYNTVTTGGNASQATTWMKNEDNSSWGDSFGATSTDFITNTPTINGLEYEPSIIFGDAKFLGWNDFSSLTSYGSFIRDYLNTNPIPGYEPIYVNNDATNIWTQVYSMGALGEAADGLVASNDDEDIEAIDDKADDATLQTRYGSATEAAKNYENAIRGNMLYIASQIDSGAQAKKTVAYLYAIDASGTAYFFTPQADQMLEGCDTGT